MKEKRQDTIYMFKILWELLEKKAKEEDRSRNYIVEKVVTAGIECLYPKELKEVSK